MKLLAFLILFAMLFLCVGRGFASDGTQPVPAASKCPCGCADGQPCTCGDTCPNGGFLSCFFGICEACAEKASTPAKRMPPGPGPSVAYAPPPAKECHCPFRRLFHAAKHAAQAAANTVSEPVRHFRRCHGGCRRR